MVTAAGALSGSVSAILIPVSSKSRVFVGGCHGEARRALLYFAGLGLGLLLLLVLGIAPSDGDHARWIQGTLGVALSMLGIVGAFLSRSVLVDGDSRCVTETFRFMGIRVVSRSFRFESFSCIETTDAGFESSDWRCYRVGLRLRRGRVVWIGQFQAPASQPPPGSLTLVEDLSVMTGLQHAAAA